MGSCLGHKQVTPSEIAGSHLGSHMVQIWDPRWDWRDPTREKHRLLGGIGGILHGTKLGSRVGLEGSHLGFEARFHAGFCLECSWRFQNPGRDPRWDWRDPTRDPTWNPTRDPIWDKPGMPGGISGIPPDFVLQRHCLQRSDKLASH